MRTFYESEVPKAVSSALSLGRCDDSLLRQPFAGVQSGGKKFAIHRQRFASSLLTTVVHTAFGKGYCLFTAVKTRPATVAITSPGRNRPGVLCRRPRTKPARDAKVLCLCDLQNDHHSGSIISRFGRQGSESASRSSAAKKIIKIVLVIAKIYQVKSMPLRSISSEIFCGSDSS